MARHDKEHGISVVLANAVGVFADGVAAGRSAVWGRGGAVAASLGEPGEGLVLIDTVSGAGVARRTG
jgi:predicted amidohydrolase